MGRIAARDAVAITRMCSGLLRPQPLMAAD
jgi:hypothetical protein